MKTMIGKLAALLLVLFVSLPSFAEPVWIDVRTVEEFTADHIEGDVNIPLAELDVEVLAATYGKDAELTLYCRSGNRAGQAQELLQAAGFTKVTNAGGIGDVRVLRDLAVQSPAAGRAIPAAPTR